MPSPSSCLPVRGRSSSAAIAMSRGSLDEARSASGRPIVSVNAAIAGSAAIGSAAAGLAFAPKGTRSAAGPVRSGCRKQTAQCREASI
ncbi:hypothetical protein [Paenibacillus thiaminolyticus]|uniref:hypothetical protein n=1 Tax=Paenibacillus thiaminolyticus TaxID=49283 RepID=UPI002542CB66|nr:hypothetical protein [Paenibacillus thiaminolyticus]WII39866.1 hypothetical protein O0V01_12585 [Paenibacillus thiaminolyticus]